MNITSLLFGQSRIESTTGNIALLFLRLTAGITIAKAGIDKLPLPNWMTDQVLGLGFPLPTFFAWMASFSEFAFGLLLAVGLLTRLSGLMLAITLGVAAFGFHKVLPFVEMHITQYFFWIFFLFTFVGAGKFSLDYYLSNSKGNLLKYRNTIGIISVVVLFTYGLYREYTIEPRVQEEFKINSISVAGSFNDWDPTANLMEQEGSLYQLDLGFDKAQLIEFKFTANKSWDYNLGEEDQSNERFPISGTAEVDGKNTTSNIKAYIPSEGKYRIIYNSENSEYVVKELN